MKALFKNIIVAILTFEAKVLLKRKRPKIIAVTGSVGKTSTKDATYTVLRDHLHARKSQKSFNSDLGVPLSVLGLDNAWNNPILWVKNILDGAFTAFFVRSYPEVLVLEMGVDRPGDMAKLTQWVRPDVVVLTRLPDVPVHVEYFDAPEDVIEEKMELVRALRKDGVFIYNNDDSVIREQAKEVPQQSFGYSRHTTAHFMIAGDVVKYDDHDKPTGMLSTLTHVDENVSIGVEGSLGVHHAYNYAAAAAVAHVFDISLADAAESLKKHKPTAGRMRILKGEGGTVLIDDTYNSSPVAVEQALETLKGVVSKGKRIAVLGDMLELGRFSTREHERIGEIVADSVDMLVTVGVRSRKMAEGAKDRGMKEERIFSFEDARSAADALAEMVTGDDVVLMKASQSIRAERIVKKLMAEPDKAKELLVRQSSEWLQKK